MLRQSRDQTSTVRVSQAIKSRLLGRIVPSGPISRADRYSFVKPLELLVCNGSLG